jgi:hypothetical protein
MATKETEYEVIPNTIWCDYGDGRQVVRIVDIRSDGRVVIERLAGTPDHTLHRELTVTHEQLTMAYHPA